MEVAIDFEGDVLRGFDHVLDGDDVGLTGEMITALGATDRIHQAGTPQPQEDLLDVIVGQALLLGELACRDRPLPRTPREVHGDDQPVLGPGGDAHGCNIGRQPRAAQPHLGRQRRQRLSVPPIAALAALCRPASGSRSPPPAPRTRFPRSYAAATGGARLGSTWPGRYRNRHRRRHAPPAPCRGRALVCRTPPGGNRPPRTPGPTPAGPTLRSRARRGWRWADIRARSCRR